MKKFLKMTGIAYISGVLATALFLAVYSMAVENVWEWFYTIHFLVSLPFTPVGVPFFLGAMLGVHFYLRRLDDAAK